LLTVTFQSTKFGFEKEKAAKVYDAIQKSSCSLEVKGMARQVAESYDLQPVRAGQ